MTRAPWLSEEGELIVEVLFYHAGSPKSDSHAQAREVIAYIKRAHQANLDPRVIRAAFTNESPDDIKRILEWQEDSWLPAPSCRVCGDILTDRSVQPVQHIGWLLFGQCVKHGPMALQWDANKWVPIDMAFDNVDGPWSGAQ